jgi:hypothetical protein
MSGHPRHFNFTGSSLVHELQYQFSSGPCSSSTSTPPGPCYGNGNMCEPFTIDTAPTSLTLRSVVPQGSWSTNVTITIGTVMTINPGMLPNSCNYFPQTCNPSCGTFVVSGHITYSGTITSMTCTLETVVVPAPPCPPPCCVCTWPCQAPAPCPVYACPPRPGCYLTRLFARRSCRNFCW